MTAKVLLAILLLTVSAAPVEASPDPYDAGVFFDSAGSQVCWFIGPFAQFNLYVVAFNLDGQVFGYEGSVTSSEGWFPEDGFGITRLGTTFAGPSPHGGEDVNFIVGTGGCIDGSGAFVAVHYACGWFTTTPPTDLLLCLGPSTPSSFTPATPGYLRCDGSLQAWGLATLAVPYVPAGCAVGNPSGLCGVESTHRSFGSVKARF